VSLCSCLEFAARSACKERNLFVISASDGKAADSKEEKKADSKASIATAFASENKGDSKAAPATSADAKAADSKEEKKTVPAKKQYRKLEDRFADPRALLAQLKQVKDFEAQPSTIPFVSADSGDAATRSRQALERQRRLLGLLKCSPFVPKVQGFVDEPFGLVLELRPPAFKATFDVTRTDREKIAILSQVCCCTSTPLLMLLSQLSYAVAVCHVHGIVHLNLSSTSVCFDHKVRMLVFLFCLALPCAARAAQAVRFRTCL
jgi:hypothetical protein